MPGCRERRPRRDRGGATGTVAAIRRKGHHCHGLTHLSWAERKIFYRVLGKKFCGLFIYPGQSVRQVVAVSAPGDRGLNR
ncbi:hypothetical protein ACN71_01360 [Escherichia coli]|nr:hypothetical protein ACN71_01360 [Escherichia coli]